QLLPTKYFGDSPGGMKATEGVKFISDIDKEGFPVLRVETVIDEVIKERRVLEN
ncbi:32584_t:CDS:2, partial [Racocetra persica]